MEDALEISRNCFQEEKRSYIKSYKTSQSLYAFRNDFKHSTRIITRFRTSFTNPA